MHLTRLSQLLWSLTRDLPEQAAAFPGPSCIVSDGEGGWYAGLNGVSLTPEQLHLQSAQRPAPDDTLIAGALPYELGRTLIHAGCGHPNGDAQPVCFYYPSYFRVDGSGRIFAENMPSHTPLPAHLDAMAATCYPTPEQHAEAFALTGPFTPDQTRDAYRQAFEKIQDYLLNGDIYQANLTQRFSTGFTGDPLAAFIHLAHQHPAPHAAYFEIGRKGSPHALLSLSPERFIRVAQGQVISEPIKGSRPRGTSSEQDDQLAHALLQHPKDRAENLMIVDLLRNDLGRFCIPGTIQADPLFSLKRFSNVQHLVSTVQGRLRPEHTPLDILWGIFPGGSITGAPKQRAMEILAELETTPRDFYCGSIFSLQPNGVLESNIAIRTFQVRDRKIVCHGGGGIVADSDADTEYAESIFKVKAFMNALESKTGR